MEKAGICGNYNKVPFDPRPANDPSGLRLGTPSVTTRGMKEPEMEQIARLIKKVAENHQDELNLARVRAQVAELCGDFPAPGLPV